MTELERLHNQYRDVKTYVQQLNGQLEGTCDTREKIRFTRAIDRWKFHLNTIEGMIIFETNKQQTQ